MDKRYYTVAEVNAMVPTLEDAFGRIMRVRTQLKALYQKLDAQRLAPQGDDFDPVVRGAPADAIRDRVTFKALLEVLQAEVARVLELGCQIKDVEIGLVDWFARSGARDVFLCWRFGEKEVGFWHDLDTGFAGRRPVAELQPPVPEPPTVH